MKGKAKVKNWINSLDPTPYEIPRPSTISTPPKSPDSQSFPSSDSSESDLKSHLPIAFIDSALSLQDITLSGKDDVHNFKSLHEAWEREMRKKAEINYQVNKDKMIRDLDERLAKWMDFVRG
jgi:hypothetical protein